MVAFFGVKATLIGVTICFECDFRDDGGVRHAVHTMKWAESWRAGGFSGASEPACPGLVRGCVDRMIKAWPVEE